MTRPVFARGTGTSPEGPPGRDGLDGLPGVNAVANDTATASYIASPISATATALSASIEALALVKGHTEHTADTAFTLVEITSDGSAYSAMHITAGPNVAPGLAYLIGIGNDYGSQPGLVVANKAAGRGLAIDNQPSVSNAEASGLYLNQRSTVAPGAILEQNATGAGTLLVLRVANVPGAAPSVGQRLATFARAGNHLMGYMDAYDGTLRWLDPVRADSTLTLSNGTGAGATAKLVLTDDRAFPVIIEAGALLGSSDSVNDGAITGYRAAGSNYYSYRQLWGNGTFALQSSPIRAKGSQVWSDVLKIGIADPTGAGYPTLAFFGRTGSGNRPATANATDLATAITLVNALKADLVAFGLKDA